MKAAKQILLTTILAATSATTAHADDVAGLPETQSQQSVDGGPQTTLQKYGKANYLAWLTGPRTEGLSGNKGGTGTNLMLRNYPNIGGKFNENVSLVFTPQFTQIWDEKTALEERHFTFDNPYFTLEDTKVLHSDLYGTNLDAYIRVYLPVSRFTHDQNNSGYLPTDASLAPNDNGNGEIRLYLNPTKTFLDGKLTLSGAVLANYKFNRLSADERIARQQADIDLHGLENVTPRGDRENMYVFLDPTVTYSVHPKLDLYLEYASGYLHHSTSGHWTSTNHPSEGQYVSPGANWTAVKNLNVNPYISYGPVFQGLVKADIGLQVTYTFL